MIIISSLYFYRIMIVLHWGISQAKVTGSVLFNMSYVSLNFIGLVTYVPQFWKWIYIFHLQHITEMALYYNLFWILCFIFNIKEIWTQREGPTVSFGVHYVAVIHLTIAHSLPVRSLAGLLDRRSSVGPWVSSSWTRPSVWVWIQGACRSVPLFHNSISLPRFHCTVFFIISSEHVTLVH